MESKAGSERGGRTGGGSFVRGLSSEFEKRRLRAEKEGLARVEGKSAKKNHPVRSAKRSRGIFLGP